MSLITGTISIVSVCTECQRRQHVNESAADLEQVQLTCRWCRTTHQRAAFLSDVRRWSGATAYSCHTAPTARRHSSQRTPRTHTYSTSDTAAVGWTWRLCSGTLLSASMCWDWLRYTPRPRSTHINSSQSASDVLNHAADMQWLMFYCSPISKSCSKELIAEEEEEEEIY